MNDITVLDNVVFALESELAGFLALRLTAKNHEVIVSNDLGTDKTTLDVAMNLSGSLARDRFHPAVRLPSLPFPPKPDRPIRAASIHPGKPLIGADPLYRQPD